MIAEGEPDFLTDATAWTVAVEVAGSGQWTDTNRRAHPGGHDGHPPHDQDDAGDEYAPERITASLWGRCRSWSPIPKPAVRGERTPPGAPGGGAGGQGGHGALRAPASDGSRREDTIRDP